MRMQTQPLGGFSSCEGFFRTINCYRRTIVVASQRVAKDPKKDFGNDYEAVRRHLESQGNGTSFSDLLNGISQLSFGQRADPSNPLARLYRWIMQGGMLSRPPSPLNYEGPISDQQEDNLGRLATVTLLSRAQLLKIASKYPDILDSEPRALTKRLLEVRDLLPGCDISLLLYRAPDLFLQPEPGWAECRPRMIDSMEVLRAGLKGAPLERMVEEDPWFPIRLDCRESLSELRSLWGVLEVDSLQESEPERLLLALKALARVAPAKN